MDIDIINLNSISEEELPFFKCPFRNDKNNNLKSCYGRKCMAFRADNETFWCAMVEAYGKNEKSSKHPIEMLDGDDNW